MLVLSRKIGQKIIVNDSIILTITAVKGNMVRVGIDAPPHIRIVREEIYSPHPDGIWFDPDDLLKESG